ncbi:subtilisin-like protease [Streptomyces lincolnensis]|uniref:Subtilisin-like protease n=1 Tax=Streptomyces lincolnensis TaxID=1915 RepID=A0A1B1MPU2_STRLN|nr:S8 family serine peptidase [Streptomyces lincolnensis]ANS70630.1 subtilisin-like protease [Streptomyces lincolnensis]
MRSTARARTAALAAVVAGTLVTGAATADGQPAQAAGAGTAAQDARRAPAKAKPPSTVTLITGDRVVVGSDGQVVRLVRGKGREGIGFSVRREAGHTYVVPQDALRPVADGVLDRRLFDVAQLVKDGYGDAHRTTLPLIIGYGKGKQVRQGGTGSRTRVRDRFAGLAVRERKALPAVDGEAFKAPKSGAPALWAAVTGSSSARTADSTAAGGIDAPARPVAHVWLDAKVRGTLAESVPQIGAPTMWKAGFTGKGVKVAVLDSGVDETHPDLKGVEIAQKNFSESPDEEDRVGHGTHVASIIAGSGVKSGGLYKGVAPDVQLLDAKVLDDENIGAASNIIAGMQWAVDQGAQVVNMSLGSLDTPGTDPKEEALARLSDKALFVVAAGNSGDGPRTIYSPGSAPEALTVGAVDKQEAIADFSSRGPNLDGTPKPDITGPGVDITAAQTTQSHQPVGEDYVPLSGTSMATPHVAGAAALVLQQHPDLGGARLKALLTGSAKPNPLLNAHQQGAGRVDLERAATALVVSEPGSLGFGTQAWPHTDDTPVSKILTYRNHGTKAVTLSLSASGTDSSGRPAPAGMFTVKDAQLTVPAGGTAQTTVTADTRQGTVDGVFGGSVLASGDGQEVRTGLVVDREVESYDVTVRHIGTDGAVPGTYATTINSVDGSGRRVELPETENGTVVQRMAKGTYQLEGLVFGKDNELGFFVQPVLEVTKNVTVTLDSRKAKPFALKTPDPAAELVTSIVGYDDTASGTSNTWSTSGVPPIRTAALGPASSTMRAQFNGVWKTPGKNVDYRLAFNRKGSFFTGLNRTLTRADLAEVKFGFGASVTGAQGQVHITPMDEDGFTVNIKEPALLDLPYATTHYLSTTGVRWSWQAAQFNADGEARMSYAKDWVAYKPGSSHTLRFNTGVVGPDLAAGSPEQQGAERTGDHISAMIPLFNDGSGNPGSSTVTGGFARLESGGRILAEGPPTDWVTAEVPAASAAYRLTVQANRSAEDTSTSTKVAGVWTFSSARPASDGTTRLPLSTVRLAPKLSLKGTAPAGGTLTVPLKLAGAAAAAGQVAALTVNISYDGGRTWKPLTVTTDAKGARSVTVKHPATAKSVSFRVDLKDKAGNTMRETITDAYRLTP